MLFTVEHEGRTMDALEVKVAITRLDDRSSCKIVG
jgi:hypothetical protein